MALETILSITGITVPIVGWALLVYQNGKNRGSTDTEVKNDIKSIKEDLSNINKTLGNGGYSGLKGAINDMKVNCADQMSGLKVRVDALCEERREKSKGD